MLQVIQSQYVLQDKYNMDIIPNNEDIHGELVIPDPNTHFMINENTSQSTTILEETIVDLVEEPDTHIDENLATETPPSKTDGDGTTNLIDNHNNAFHITLRQRQDTDYKQLNNRGHTRNIRRKTCEQYRTQRWATIVERRRRQKS